MTILAV